MKRRRHTPEQIIRKLREADRLLGEGKTIPEVGEAAGGLRADVSPVADPVRRDEGRRREAAEGARAGERALEADRGRPGAGDRGAEGDREGKLVSPARRRQAVAMLRDRLGVSERRACQVVGQHRSTQRHEPKLAEDDAALRAELRAVLGSGRGGDTAARTTALREQGWEVNRKRMQRLWREEGLRVPQRKRKRQRLGESTVPAERLRAERPDQVWAFDFQFDQTADGRVLKLLHVVDEFTREALAMLVARSIDADQTVGVLDRLVAERGAPGATSGATTGRR